MYERPNDSIQFSEFIKPQWKICFELNWRFFVLVINWPLEPIMVAESVEAFLPFLGTIRDTVHAIENCSTPLSPAK